MSEPRWKVLGAELPRPVPMLIDRVEAARLLCVHPNTLDNLRKRGELRAVRAGKRVLFDVEDLRAFIESRKEGAA